MKAVEADRASADLLRDTSIPAPRLNTRLLQAKAVPGLVFGVSVSGIALGTFGLGPNTLHTPSVLLLALLCLGLLSLSLHARRLSGQWEWKLLILAGVSLASAAFAFLLPEYMYGLQFNAIAHRSLFSAVLLLVVAVPAACSSLYYLLGATPRAEDLSRYPLILLPVVLVLVAYALVIVRLVGDGLPELDWTVITTAFHSEGAQQAGMKNHILGTLLLVGLTSLIALPVGMGAGVFVSEYSRGWPSTVVRLSATALRAISLLILALTAVTLVRYSSGTFLSDVFSGYWHDANGHKHVTNGSFVTAAIVLSLLVIPVIARATEEGCRSLPSELREGSFALGASEGHTLTRVVLPWAFPNIVTALLLGAAEAAGSVAVLLFMAGTGEHGVSPLSEVTSLAFLVFDAQQGARPVQVYEGPYQYSAALLVLLMTFGLSAAALVLKWRFTRRYRGT
jgi:phosphate transport system permease protein